MIRLINWYAPAGGFQAVGDAVLDRRDSGRGAVIGEARWSFLVTVVAGGGGFCFGSLLVLTFFSLFLSSFTKRVNWWGEDFFLISLIFLFGGLKVKKKKKKLK